jgi:hypothetical protein
MSLTIDSVLSSQLPLQYGFGLCVVMLWAILVVLCVTLFIVEQGSELASFPAVLCGVYFCEWFRLPSTSILVGAGRLISLEVVLSEIVSSLMMNGSLRMPPGLGQLGEIAEGVRPSAQVIEVARSISPAQPHSLNAPLRPISNALIRAGSAVNAITQWRPQHSISPEIIVSQRIQHEEEVILRINDMLVAGRFDEASLYALREAEALRLSANWTMRFDSRIASLMKTFRHTLENMAVDPRCPCYVLSSISDVLKPSVREFVSCWPNVTSRIILMGCGQYPRFLKYSIPVGMFGTLLDDKKLFGDVVRTVPAMSSGRYQMYLDQFGFVVVQKKNSGYDDDLFKFRSSSKLNATSEVQVFANKYQAMRGNFKILGSGIDYAWSYAPLTVVDGSKFKDFSLSEFQRILKPISTTYELCGGGRHMTSLVKQKIESPVWPDCSVIKEPLNKRVLFVSPVGPKFR